MTAEKQNILDRYELGQRIFSGGQGLLRRGFRKSDGLEVVIKKYSQMEDAQTWNAYEEGQVGASREISFLERANKDGVRGVPTIIEYGITGDWEQPVAVFKPIPGQNLLEKVSDMGYNPSLERVLEIFRLLKEPVEYAHKSNGTQPVIHRDIKPENIFVNGEGVVLGDWAAATPTSGKTYHGKTSVASLYYTAPEVFAGKPFDQKADIYSLGRVLQLMLLGRDLFEASEGNPTKKDFKNLNIPKKLVKVLMKSVSEKPEERYNSVEEFYNAFESVALGVNLPVLKTNVGGLEEITGAGIVPAEHQRLKEIDAVFIKDGKIHVLGRSGEEYRELSSKYFHNLVHDAKTGEILEERVIKRPFDGDFKLPENCGFVGILGGLVSIVFGALAAIDFGFGPMLYGLGASSIPFASSLAYHLIPKIHKKTNIIEDYKHLVERSKEENLSKLREATKGIKIIQGGIRDASETLGRDIVPLDTGNSRMFLEAGNEFGLRVRAHELGADAIINFEQYEGGTYRGTPIKFVDDGKEVKG